MITKHHFSDRVYAKESFLDAGIHVPKHVHNYSHLSILARGRALVTIDGVTETYTGPVCIEIKKNVSHSVQPITNDVVWYCIHATDCSDITTIDEVLIETA